MMKKYKDTFLALDWMLFFVLSAIFLTIMISPWIHQSDVLKYHLDRYSGLDQATIKENFAALSGYLWIWHREPLTLNNFVMSTNGAIHFAEVKQLVDLLQILWLVCGAVGIVGAVRHFQKRDIAFIRLTALLMIVVPLTIGALVTVNFDRAFVVFHHLLFNNDYWIFDERTDPVIQILPSEFFMHCFIAIVLFVLILALLVYGFYRYQKIRNEKEALHLR